MRRSPTRAALCAAALIGLNLPLAMPALGQQQGGQRQVYTCAAIHARCVGRSTGREAAMCDGYYDNAKRTGIWPAFGSYPAVPCKR
jgi:hypothetical protein